MKNRFNLQNDVFFLFTFKQATLKIFFFGMKLWPEWFRTNTFQRKRGQDVLPGPRWNNQARYWLCTLTIQWLIFEMVIPYWEITKAGEMYPKNYVYSNDPYYEIKLAKYEDEDQD